MVDTAACLPHRRSQPVQSTWNHTNRWPSLQAIFPPQVPTCYEHSIIPLSGGNTHLARKTQYLLKFKTLSQIMNRQIESAGSYLQSVKSSVFGWVFPCSCGCGVTMELGIYCHLADVFLPRRLGSVWAQRFYSRLSRTPPLKCCTSCFSPNQEINKSVVWFN